MEEEREREYEREDAQDEECVHELIRDFLEESNVSIMSVDALGETW